VNAWLSNNAAPRASRNDRRFAFCLKNIRQAPFLAPLTTAAVQLISTRDCPGRAATARRLSGQVLHSESKF
jgi:hypothetical protein